MKKRIAAFLLACCLTFGLSLRSRAEDYTYTVRFYSGRQGTFGGEEVLVFDGLHYGERVSFRVQMVTLVDESKYYIKGIRESGKDNNTVGLTSFLVTKDQDYTVAYGILGESVAYTINYRDPQGVSIAPSETYYGNVNDKLVIAYQYVDGYEPEFYNITQTLSKNAAANVFDFIYHPVERSGTESVVVVDEGGFPPAPAAPADGGEGSAEDPAADRDAPSDDAAALAAPSGEGPADGPGAGTRPGEPGGTIAEARASEGKGTHALPAASADDPIRSGPEELLDLDLRTGVGPDEGPAAGAEARTTPRPGKKVPPAVPAAALAGCGLAAVLIGCGIRKKRKERDHEEKNPPKQP